MQSLERAQPFPPLCRQETREHLTVDEIGDQDLHRPPADPGDIAVMVLSHNGAGAELVELADVTLELARFRVPAFIEYLRRPRYAGLSLLDLVDLALPAPAEKLHHVVVATPRQARPQVETLCFHILLSGS